MIRKKCDFLDSTVLKIVVDDEEREAKTETDVAETIADCLSELKQQRFLKNYSSTAATRIITNIAPNFGRHT